MIRDHFLPAILERFPEHPFVFSEPPEPIASLESPCEALKAVAITDDGDEATVFFTSGITHSHFGCYDDASPTQQEQKIASDVVAFLSDLFADRVVIWSAAGGVAAGMKSLDRADTILGKSSFRKQYVWSGPV